MALACGYFRVVITAR